MHARWKYQPLRVLVGSNVFDKPVADDPPHADGLVRFDVTDVQGSPGPLDGELRLLSRPGREAGFLPQSHIFFDTWRASDEPVMFVQRHRGLCLTLITETESGDRL